MDRKEPSWLKFAEDTLGITEFWAQIKAQNPLFAKAIEEYYTNYPDYAERYEELERIVEGDNDHEAEEVC